MNEREALLNAFSLAGGEAAVLKNPQTAHLLVNGHKILSSHLVDGLDVEVRETPSGISAAISIQQGVRIEQPVHLCFGMVHPQGRQEIDIDARLERGSSARFLAHCLFPNAEKIQHIMSARLHIAEGAELHYSETHVHGPHGGVEVIPQARIQVGSNARYTSEFTLTGGRVGMLDINYEVICDADSITELIAKVYGRGDDVIKIRESIALNGDNARGLIKTRIALADDAQAEVTGITEGNAAGARGHVDCMELVKDRALARAIPIVNVTHPLAKVTHEAAIGTVDQRQLETLMAHGLSPEEAVDVIVRGVLR